MAIKHYLCSSKIQASYTLCVLVSTRFRVCLCQFVPSAAHAVYCLMLENCHKIALYLELKNSTKLVHSAMVTAVICTTDKVAGGVAQPPVRV